MPYDDTTRQDLPIYVVMDSNVLIAQDICGALQAFGPCSVIMINDPADLTDAVDRDAVVTAAILELCYEKALHLALAETFVLRGAKIILTVGESDRAAVLDHGWSMLVRPFTEEMLHAVLSPSLRDAESAAP